MIGNNLLINGTSRFLNDIYTKGIKSTNFQYDADTPSVTVGTRSSGTVGAYSFTAGQDNIASGSQSMALGYGNTASADQAFVCGNGNTAAGQYSHAEGKGNSTTSNAWYQHVEGQGCTAGGDAGHAEGCGTVTAANYSHAEGLGTYAGSQAQHVFGKYNIKDTSGTYVEIVGKGTSDANADRADARTLDWNGNEWLLGSLTTTDVIKGSGTWDGTNTSLTTAVNSAKGTITQTATDSTNKDYEVLFSGTEDNTTRTERARKTQYLKYNPDAQQLTIGDFSGKKFIRIAPYIVALQDYEDTNITPFVMIRPKDIVLGGKTGTTSSFSANTWDGTHTSLKNAITAIYTKTLCYSASISRGSGWTQRSTTTAFPSSTTGTYLFMIKDSNGTIYSRIPIPAADFAGTTSTRPLIVRSNGASSDANNIMTYWSSTTKFYTYAGSSSMPTGTFTLVIHYTPLNI